jgi:class 3 adenylate cyclase
MSITTQIRHQRRLDHFIESMDRPLLGLALITVALYLLDLKGLLGPARRFYQAFTLLVDFTFVFDFVLKARTFGKDYLRTPWALIDFLSCLPVLDILAIGFRSLPTLQFIRVFRMLRILRTLRVLRALRAMSAFDQFVKEAEAAESKKHAHNRINLAVVAMTIVVIGLIVVARTQMERHYFDEVDTGLMDGAPLSYFEAMGGSTKPPTDSRSFTRTALIEGKPVTLYFDLEHVDERSNDIEFFLIMGMIITIGFFMYIINYHHFDITQAQLRAVLNLALPRQVADRFVTEPDAYQRKTQSPGSIVFMDFVGFTQTCEQLANDPDRLSAHLEQAMDRLVCELLKHDVIIDKFIGDAVMSFRGGPLVEGSLGEHAYRVVRASLDSVKALAQLNDRYFRRVKVGGASSIDCLIGAFGTSARLSYTILGDAVNVAARLEPASVQCGTQNLFCELTYRLCANRPDLVWRRWGKIRLAGRSTPVMVYEVFEAVDFPDRRFLDTFHRALEAFELREFAEARTLFLQAADERPGGDEPCQRYVAWCDTLIAEPPGHGWEPVFETHK